MVIAQSGLRAVSTFRGKVVDAATCAGLANDCARSARCWFIRVAKIHSTREKSEDDSRDQGVLGTVAGDIVRHRPTWPQSRFATAPDVDGRADIYALGVFMRTQHLCRRHTVAEKPDRGFARSAAAPVPTPPGINRGTWADWRRSFTHIWYVSPHTSQILRQELVTAAQTQKHENLRALS